MTPLGRVLMVQGTSSHAGKSVLVTALCRLFAQEGLRVAPFKAQNMSNNAHVTPDGGEIGRAQAIQADAARVPASVDMNPILLKPETNQRSQVVVLGRATGSLGAADYLSRRAQLWPVVTGALDRLRAAHDLVVIEGAGSPAEINLRDREIVNMRVARHAEAPVILVADIDRGGVFASIVGTMTLLEQAERSLVRGFVINRFRGDVRLLEPGIGMLRAWVEPPVLGVVPWLDDLRVPQEDSLGLELVRPPGPLAVLDIAAIRLPHVANFDDLDPLSRHPGTGVRWVGATVDLGDPDLIVLPGSKTTIADLAWLRGSGFADAIVRRRAGGTAVLGLCGGYQMLGRSIHDPDGAESDTATVEGLGLLPVETTFRREKATHRVEGTIVAGHGLLGGGDGLAVSGYEIHLGRSVVHDGATPLLRIASRSGERVDTLDGAVDPTGTVLGTYVHGLLHAPRLLQRLLENLAARRGVALPPTPVIDQEPDAYDDLVERIRPHLDLDAIRAMIGLPSDGRP